MVCLSKLAFVVVSGCSFVQAGDVAACKTADSGDPMQTLFASMMSGDEGEMGDAMAQFRKLAESGQIIAKVTNGNENMTKEEFSAALANHQELMTDEITPAFVTERFNEQLAAKEAQRQLAEQIKAAEIEELIWTLDRNLDHPRIAFDTKLTNHIAAESAKLQKAQAEMKEMMATFKAQLGLPPSEEEEQEAPATCSLDKKAIMEKWLAMTAHKGDFLLKRQKEEAKREEVQKAREADVAKVQAQLEAQKQEIMRKQREELILELDPELNLEEQKFSEKLSARVLAETQKFADMEAELKQAMKASTEILTTEARGEMAGVTGSSESTDASIKALMESLPRIDEPAIKAEWQEMKTPAKRTIILAARADLIAKQKASEQAMQQAQREFEETHPAMAALKQEVEGFMGSVSDVEIPNLEKVLEGVTDPLDKKTFLEKCAQKGIAEEQHEKLWTFYETQQQLKTGVDTLFVEGGQVAAIMERMEAADGPVDPADSEALIAAVTEQFPILGAAMKEAKKDADAAAAAASTPPTKARAALPTTCRAAALAKETTPSSFLSCPSVAC